MIVLTLARWALQSFGSEYGRLAKTSTASVAASDRCVSGCAGRPRVADSRAPRTVLNTSRRCRGGGEVEESDSSVMRITRDGWARGKHSTGAWGADRAVPAWARPGRSSIILWL